MLLPIMLSKILNSCLISPQLMKRVAEKSLPHHTQNTHSKHPSRQGRTFFPHVVRTSTASINKRALSPSRQRPATTRAAASHRGRKGRTSSSQPSSSCGPQDVDLGNGEDFPRKDDRPTEPRRSRKEVSALENNLWYPRCSV